MYQSYMHWKFNFHDFWWRLVLKIITDVEVLPTHIIYAVVLIYCAQSLDYNIQKQNSQIVGSRRLKVKFTNSNKIYRFIVTTQCM